MFTTPTPAETASAIRRLAEIGWVESSSQVHNTGKITFTTQGAANLTHLGLLLGQVGALSAAEFSAVAALAVHKASIDTGLEP